MMKKLKMIKANKLTFEEGCNMYLEDCRQRNLRDGIISITGKVIDKFQITKTLELC